MHTKIEYLNMNSNQNNCKYADYFIDAENNERRDYSCAVFDGRGEVLAMGDHMPVHLGSMPMSVKAAVDKLQLNPGDVAILNDPFCGGTHLPDITLVSPVWLRPG